MKDKVLEYLRDELDGFAQYYSLYIEYFDLEIGNDFYKMAIDEFAHARFWLENAKLFELNYSKLEQEFNEFEKMINGVEIYE